MRAFISYAHTDPDRDLAVWLDERLPAATGLDVVRDEHSISNGVPFHPVIHSLLKDCDILFFLWSDTSTNAPYCAEELRTAFKHGLLIFPVRLHSGLLEHDILSQYSDIPFDGDRDTLLRRISERLAHLETPEGRVPLLEHVLMRFKDRRRRPDVDQAENERNIATLEARLAETRKVLTQDSLTNRLLGGTAAGTPADADGFQNREKEREQLLALLRSGGSDVILALGEDGVGKTRLIDKVLDRLQGEAQIIRHEVYPSRAFGAGDFISSLERRLPSVDDASQYRPMDPVMVKLRILFEKPATQPVILVIDGAEHLLDPRTHQIMDDDLDDALQLLGGGRSRLPQPVKVLLISRIRPDPTERNSWPLDASSLPVIKGLGPEPFKRFLQGFDQQQVWFGDAEPEQFAELHTLTGGSPRAGELIYAIFMNTRHELELPVLQRRLPSGSPEHVRRRLIERLVKGMDDDRRRAAEVVAAFGFPVPVAYVAAVLDIGERFVHSTLKQLVDLKILRQTWDKRYFAPPPDDRYILSGLPPDAADGPSRRALYRAAARHLATQRPEPVATVADLTIHRYEIDLLRRADEHAAAFDLISMIDHDYLHRWGFSSLLTWQREQLQDDLADDKRRTLNLDGIGYSYWSRGKLEPARAGRGGSWSPPEPRTPRRSTWPVGSVRLRTRSGFW
ncbi:TIR domain-containing protein [Dactylosporangium sp. NPDC000521]|uniref:TIR domain-containing protein n=1 Tax=Dactylosporangium sp. NPDC000521 TaxID=3363975 RepID=UPI00368644E7